MGDRRQVRVTYPAGQKIYFYTHWDGYVLPNIVAEALDAGKDRWADPPYLARVIFNYMTMNDPTGVTGYGISPEIQDSNYGDDKDVYITLSYGTSGRVGIGAADMKYKDFIREYKKEET